MALIRPGESQETPMALQIRTTDVLILLAAGWLVFKLVQRLTNSRGATGTTLRSPPNESYLFGMTGAIVKSKDTGILFQDWAEKYGPVYQIAAPFGAKRIVLCDPKAVNHMYAFERSVYVKSQLGRVVVANLFGRGLLWAEGESHKRQRKTLTPAFSNAAIRRLTAVFYDSAYKLKGHWDTTLDAASSIDGAIIDVEHWMNRVALDSIGIAGFAHDFGTLDGKHSAVATAFDNLSFGSGSAINNMIFLLGLRLPFLAHLPSRRNRVARNLRLTMSKIADELLQKTRKEKQTHITDETMDRSVIGLLLKAETEDAELHMDPDEVLAQMNVLLLAGYETTSISLTWALIELARLPEKQAKLRAELTQFGASDPTWDELVSPTALPYLDGVTLETLRMHPPLGETTRVAGVDDILPVSEPITLPDGEVVDQIVVAKGTLVTASIRCMNQSERFWGPNAKEWEPERWFTLDKDNLRAKEITGHRHLITFTEGPRVCLGKQFALAEFKSVLSVLIRNYTFEFPGGPETELGVHRSIIPRPKVAGEAGANVPLRVRRVEY
ncbi:Cytochrome P450 [Mycena kentingensis (nom. inval.)]|nr:Cytochrome P450 [Mycena kentingensis (nom. inval.)]